MHLRLASSLLALLGGVLLLLVGALALGAAADWHAGVALVGYAATLLALAILGYSLVTTAPVWLGIIVGVCTPLLVASVWQALAQPITDRSSNGEAIVWLLGGVLALVLAALELGAHARARGARTHGDEVHRPRH
ncbi:MAG TPA: hypothetical protein VFO98_01605 [Marmoricola sp.]|jgi:hypothetical protein|nr:hypothetical protein [Marmoricola sp.]